MVNHASTLTLKSQTSEGVTFTLRRMSFGRRLDLMRRVRELAARQEFHQAGKELQEKIEAALVAGEIERLYLEWGLEGVEGLEIDGAGASVEAVLERGPEELTREILSAIRRECGLSAEERKN